MLQVGEVAPDFAVPDHNGNAVTGAALRGKKAVIWFYPKASTGG